MIGVGGAGVGRRRLYACGAVLVGVPAARVRRQTTTINWGGELPLAQGIEFV
ncbi:MAG: hypothetical protein OEP52_02860 [Acidimicrobiia bacterium]|nr:hypothetical protein [Acidimicrobiia bacterium]